MEIVIVIDIVVVVDIVVAALLCSALLHSILPMYTTEQNRPSTSNLRTGIGRKGKERREEELGVE